MSYSDDLIWDAINNANMQRLKPDEHQFYDICERVMSGETVEIDCHGRPQYGTDLVNWLSDLPAQEPNWCITVDGNKLRIRQDTGESE